MKVGELKNDQKCYKKDNAFLSEIYIKVTETSPQNEIMLNYTTHAIGVQLVCFSCDIFYLHAKVASVKIALDGILLPKFNRRGVGVRMS